MAAHQVGELGRMLQTEDGLGRALEGEIQALMIHPTWPDAYVGIAQTYVELQDWDKVEFWANACLNNCAGQDTTQIREPLNDEYLPKLLLGIAQEMKGNLYSALDIYRELEKKNLATEVTDRIKSVMAKLEQKEDVKQKEDSIDERQLTFGHQPEKSIAFFTAPIFEHWHPELMKTGGIGGAETCVMEVAARFAADGWRTVVFGTPGDHRGVHEPT